MNIMEWVDVSYSHAFLNRVETVEKRGLTGQAVR